MDKFKSPVYNVISVPVEKIVANDYNPNIVAPPEMKLLELSIWEDGYTMPCVCYYLADCDKYEVLARTWWLSERGDNRKTEKSRRQFHIRQNIGLPHRKTHSQDGIH